MPGHFALILHAHLPFVRHPEHEHFLEEEWLFEAITETYVPLLQMMQRLSHEGVPFKLTMRRRFDSEAHSLINRNESAVHQRVADDVVRVKKSWG